MVLERLRLGVASPGYRDSVESYEPALRMLAARTRTDWGLFMMLDLGTRQIEPIPISDASPSMQTRISALLHGPHISPSVPQSLMTSVYYLCVYGRMVDITTAKRMLRGIHTPLAFTDRHCATGGVTRQKVAKSIGIEEFGQVEWI